MALFNANTNNAEIKQGERFDGDDSFWVVEHACEDVGPFDTREDAEKWFAEFITQQELIDAAESAAEWLMDAPKGSDQQKRGERLNDALEAFKKIGG